VPSIRIQFREDVIEAEHRFMREVNAIASNPFYKRDKTHPPPSAQTGAMTERKLSSGSLNVPPGLSTSAGRIPLRRGNSQQHIEYHAGQ